LLRARSFAQVLPTIHINDVCSIVAKLLETESLPYLLAVDAPPEDAETPQTLANVVAALSTELGVGDVLPAPPREEVLLARDYEFFQIGAPIADAPGLKLKSAAVNDLGIEWHAPDGLLAAMPSVVEEYRTSRGLQPLRLLVHGNDDLGKTELASALAEEYKLPYVLASAALAEAAAKEDELGAEITAAQASGAVRAKLHNSTAPAPSRRSHLAVAQDPSLARVLGARAQPWARLAPGPRLGRGGWAEAP